MRGWGVGQTPTVTGVERKPPPATPKWPEEMVGSKWSSSWNSSSTSSELESSFRFGTEEGEEGGGCITKLGTGLAGKAGTGWEGRGGGFASAGGACLLLPAGILARELAFFDGIVGLELGLANRGFVTSAWLGILVMLVVGSGEFVGVKSGASDDSGEEMEMCAKRGPLGERGRGREE